MSRKKTDRKKTAEEPTENTAIAVMDTETQPTGRPAWIDGAPADADGQIIREGYRKPPTELPRQAQGAPVQGGDMHPAEPAAERSAESATEAHGKNWSDPYKAIFSCPEMGFELGENRRFKQRVFRFTEKPTAEILSALKEHGFIYRAAEKAWTVNATPQSRKLTDDLARDWAGPNYTQGVER